MVAQPSYHNYLFFVFKVLGLSAVLVLAVWMNKYYGGFAWDGSHQQFNVHPMCMVVGLVLLYGKGK